MSNEHNHSHNVENYNKAFGFGIALNIIYIIVEVTYGLIINSTALLADAGHNFSDVLGLILACGGAYLAQTAVTKNRTYGLRKATILAALFNAVLLLIAVGAITIEAIRKIIEPEPVGGTTMIIVAGIGVFINTLTALLFLKGSEKDLNIKGAFLHMAADAGVSLGVVLAGLIINITGMYIFDPIISIVIVVVITIGTWGLLKDSLHLSMDAVPRSIDYEKVQSYLSSLEGVKEVHDLHIWAMSTTEIALTVHLVYIGIYERNNFIKNISEDLYHKFNIVHTTIQIEDIENNNCNQNQF
ncbi:cation diffusion facilitator family transporter [Melioribacter roseus P3M-2]|uniref:Cation diffusion facilitator family transporter n=1 Tax=Melioribacter roseus (strain DSM 23840 / JCM 17771 / VKM B-2668 / P3M-2) TaxID=1191523 RepID=I6ZXP2_MELRP|nr:cation diffusion facilitator family transporter [Melioribacter roseus]AFN73823.1 cation diffusion facilitator family transporter [Melioribacter roseus P3M-2]